MKKNAKAEKILDVALALLKTDGDYGVTMRQVAAHADMTLSNVQYYFKRQFTGGYGRPLFSFMP